MTGSRMVPQLVRQPGPSAARPSELAACPCPLPLGLADLLVGHEPSWANLKLPGDNQYQPGVSIRIVLYHRNGFYKNLITKFETSCVDAKPALDGHRCP